MNLIVSIIQISPSNEIQHGETFGKINEFRVLEITRYSISNEFFFIRDYSEYLDIYY